MLQNNQHSSQGHEYAKKSVASAKYQSYQRTTQAGGLSATQSDFDYHASNSGDIWTLL